jgi:hypothetical protein
MLLWQPEPLNRNESGRFGGLKSDSTHHFFRNVCTKSGSLRCSQFSGCWLIFSIFLTDEFWLSLWKIVRSSVILLLPLLSHTIITLSVSRTATATTVSHTMTDSTTSIPITTMIISHMITAINAVHANTTMIVRDPIMDRTIRNGTTTRVVRNTITDRNGRNACS